MTQQEKIEIVAIYDGWEKYDSIRRPVWYSKGSFRVDGFDIEHFGKYLTSLDWLHPVAMKVLDELFLVNHKLPSRIYSKIYNHCASNMKGGQYLDLFESVVEGIIFFNQQKQKENA